jgi:hypothetical protein
MLRAAGRVSRLRWTAGDGGQKLDDGVAATQVGGCRRLDLIVVAVVRAGEDRLDHHPEVALDAVEPAGVCRGRCQGIES